MSAAKLTRVVYMGTPDFAVPALAALAAAPNVELVLVVTQPDRPSGRGQRMNPPPVKQKAEELGLMVAQPERLKDNEDFTRRLKALHPDLIVVAAYGKILPKALLELPPFGCVNIHASLLPKYRGAAPIHRAVEAGERESGVTLMYMDEGLDEGDMIASERADIGGLNTGELYELLADIGACLLMREFENIARGTAQRTRQDHAAASYAPMIRKDDARLDFAQPAEAVVRRVLAMEPNPGASALLDGAHVKIRKAHATEQDAQKAVKQAQPGDVTAVSDAGIVVAAGNGFVTIEVIQLPGKKPMRVADFLRGTRIEVGARFT